MIPRWIWLASTVLFAGVTVLGCRSAPKKNEVDKDYGRPLPDGAPALVKITDPAELPDFRTMFVDRERLLQALDESLIYFGKPSSKKWFPYKTANRAITHEDQVETLRSLRRIVESSATPKEFHGYCLLAFDVYKSVGWNGKGEVLFTAYCEPIFDGQKEPSGEFKHPLYELPEDLVKAEDGTPLGRRTATGSVEPYPTRREIEEQRLLAGKELVYLRDPFEVYIAHVQGSARVNLPDGRQICIGYAGKTDRPYRSVGQKLIEDGRLSRSQLNLTELKRYFREHPEETTRVLGHNESYVFFTEREPGPFGSIGSKVTPYHTIATDKSVFPRGGPAVVEARLPALDPGRGSGLRFEKRSLLVFDQDTGGAIRSAGRGDLFVGTGPDAEHLAGHTKEEGRLMYLFRKPGGLVP